MTPLATPVASTQDFEALVLARLDAALPPVIRTGLAEPLAQLLAAATIPQRIDALVSLVEWIRAGGDPSVDLFARGPDRLTLVRSVVDPDPDLGPRFRQAVASMVDQLTGENLFGETGIPSRRGFGTELVDRALTHVLPRPRDDHDASRLLRRLFSRERDAEQFASLSPQRFAMIASLFFPPDQRGPQCLSAAFADGFRLLAGRVLAEGLDERLRARTSPGPVADSSFLRLNRLTEDVLEAWQSGGALERAASAWRSERAACRAQMTEVQRRLQSEGVSVDIVFGLQVIDQCLSRMSMMLEVMEAPPGEMRHQAIHRLAARLVVSAQEDRSVAHLVRWHLRLLGRKMVDRAGETGEHYVAYSRPVYRFIWRAAAGGGLVATALAALTLLIMAAGLAPFQAGLIVGLTYAVGLLLMQGVGFVLAARQPAMTSATLAAIFRERRGVDRLDAVVDFTARVCHSQLAAAASNILFVTAGGIAIEAAWRAATGDSFLSAPRAMAVQHSLGLWSGTMIYAALTGVILWVASLVGGWFDNWSTLHRLPLAIREHPLGGYIGQQRMVSAAGIWTRNAAGIGTSVSLGLMLGLTPSLGSYFGLPLDVRHVTLSAGQLAIATASLWPDGLGFWFGTALVGIAGTFVLNLAVSFLLAFFNAARAYELPIADQVELGRRLLHRIAHRPMEFVLPSRTPFKMPVDHVHA